MRTRIKVCGIRTLEAALAAVDAGADAIGFMFVRSSVRSIEAQEAAEIMWALPPMVTTVGVFMNASVDTFVEIEEVCPTHYAQLHGNEDEATVRACGPVIKTIRYDPGTIARGLDHWGQIDEVDAVLVDVGANPDWKALAAAAQDARVPLVISGDLTPANVGEAIRVVRPYAVDISGGVESEPGVKDRSLIEAFCVAVKDADRG
jgi:phosphoribosylanthranilate isomerase